MPTMPVARVDDSVGHTYKKAAIVVGGSIAVAIGVALLFVPGGAEVDGLVIVELGEGAAETVEVVSTIAEVLKALDTTGTLIDWFQVGSWAGGRLSSFFQDEHAGKIKSGAVRTWTESKLNARVTDPLECKDPSGTAQIIGTLILPEGGWLLGDAYDALGFSAHTGAKVAEGSKTVFVEGKNASRRSEKTSCGGWITEGASITFFGGPSVVLSGCEDVGEEGVILHTVLSWAGVVSDVLGVITSEDPLMISLQLTKFLLGRVGDAYPEFKDKMDTMTTALEHAIALKKILGSPKKMIQEIPLLIGKDIKYGVGDAPPPPPRDVVYYPN